MSDIDRGQSPVHHVRHDGFVDGTADTGHEEALEADGLPELGQVEKQLGTVAEVLALAGVALGGGAAGRRVAAGLGVPVRHHRHRLHDAARGLGQVYGLDTHSGLHRTTGRRAQDPAARRWGRWDRWGGLRG